VEELISVVSKAYEHVVGKKPPRASPEHSSMWTDTNLYWEIGVPAVKFGPPRTDPSRGTLRIIDVEDIMVAAKVDAIIALEICNA
jgi:acetylornithine deacetylase/succinyl-diaminopimelate desuccinylase-like protein